MLSIERVYDELNEQLQDLKSKATLLSVEMADVNQQGTVGLNDPYVTRKVIDGVQLTATQQIEGASVVNNQLIASDATSVTVTSEHVYIASIDGTTTIAESDGNAIEVDGSAGDWLTDLTMYFGSDDIPAKALAMETAKSGSGVAWLLSFGFTFGGTANAGTLESIEAATKYTVGKNLLKSMQTDYSDGTITCHVNGDGSLTINGSTTSALVLIGNFFTDHYTSTGQYDDTKHFMNGKYIVSTGLSESIGISLQMAARKAGGSAVTLAAVATTDTVTIDDTYPYNWGRLYLSANKSFNNVRVYPMVRYASASDASYAPYETHTTAFTETELHGLYALVGDEIITNGDVYSSSGTITRNYTYRDYAEGDESLSDCITDGTHTVVKTTASAEQASPFTEALPCVTGSVESFTYSSGALSLPVGNLTTYYKVPNLMQSDTYAYLINQITEQIPGMIQKLYTMIAALDARVYALEHPVTPGTTTKKKTTK